MVRFERGRPLAPPLPGYAQLRAFHASARHMREPGRPLSIGLLHDAIARIQYVCMYTYIYDSSRITAIEGIRVIHESSISIYIDRINRQKDTPIDTPLVLSFSFLYSNTRMNTKVGIKMIKRANGNILYMPTIII